MFSEPDTNDRCHWEGDKYICESPPTDVFLQNISARASPWLINRVEATYDAEFSQSKYVLFLILTTALGAMMWMFSTFYYGADFGRLPFIHGSSFSFVVMILIAVICYFVLWGIVAGIGLIGNQIAQVIAFCLFLAAAWVTGLLTSFMFYSYQVEYGLTFDEIRNTFLHLSVVAAIALMGSVIAGLLVEDYVSEGRGQQIGAGIAVMGIIIIIVEPLLYFMFNKWDWMVILLDVIVIGWVCLSIMFSVPELKAQLKEGAVVSASAFIFLSFANILIRLMEIYYRSK